MIGGPVLGDGPEDQILRHMRYDEPADFIAPKPNYTRQLSGDYAYLGFTIGHFGHVMSEMVHRILPTKQHHRRPRWIVVDRHDPQKLRKSHQLLPAPKRVLRFLGVYEEECEILTDDTVVERLMISEVGSHLGGTPHPAYLRMLNAFTLPRLIRRQGDRQYPAKVYVSRSLLGHTSGYLGEGYLDEIFENCGYTVFHPQKHDFVEQLQTYRNAQVLIFGEGSACHGTELFGDGVLKHTILLNRRQHQQDQFVPLLTSRSLRFDHFKENIPVGSMYADPKGRELTALGATLFTLPAMLAFLRAVGVEAPQDISLPRYLEMAEADLESYIANDRNGPHAMDPSRADIVRDSFKAAAKVVLASA